MSIDYTSYSDDDFKTNDYSVEDEVVIEEKETDNEGLMGSVYNTNKVYLRNAPVVEEGNEITVLDKGYEVFVSDILDGWCKVYTATGLEGYIMEEFVKIS